MKKSFVCIIVAIVLLMIFLVACSSASYISDQKSQVPVEIVKNSMEEVADFSGSRNIKQKDNQQYNRKRIIKARVFMETKKMEETLQNLEDALDAVGGYVESSNIRNENNRKESKLIYRIPTENLNTFKSKLSGAGNIISETINSDDITSDYYDTQSRLKVARITRKNLMKLLDKADKLSTIIQLQNKLEDKNYEIDQLTGKLKMWDVLMAMSKYTINITEVEDLSVKSLSFLDRAGKAFEGTWSSFITFCQNFIIGFIWAIPTLIVLALAILIIILVVKRLKKQ